MVALSACGGDDGDGGAGGGAGGSAAGVVGGGAGGGGALSTDDCDADLTVDPFNCGECGRTCDSRSCADRACRGELIYQAMGEATCSSFAVKDDTLYLTLDETLLRVPRVEGETAQTLQVGAPDATLSDLEIVDDRVYFVDPDRGLLSVGLDGSDMRIHYDASRVSAFTLQPGEDAIYVATSSGAVVQRVPLDGSPPTVIADNLDGVTSMASNATYVAIDEEFAGALSVYDKRSGSVTPIPLTDEHPSAPHFVGDMLYWLEGNSTINGDQAYRARVGAAPEPYAMPRELYSITSEGETVYLVGAAGVFQPEREGHPPEEELRLGSGAIVVRAQPSDGQIYYSSNPNGSCRIERVPL